MVAGQGAWSRYTVGTNGIYYLADIHRQSISPRGSIEFFRMADCSRKRVAQIDKPVKRPLSLSPDEQLLYYTRFDREINELMLVENFR